MDSDTPELPSALLPEDEEALFVYETDYEIGQDNIEVAGLDIHNPVFFLSAGLIIVFSGITLLFPHISSDYLNAARTWTLQSADWLFALTAVLVFIFCIGLTISPMGKIRLGGPTATPDFSIISWVAMLFAAGVGVGFMFYGAAEPLAYYTDWYGMPLDAEPLSREAERLAYSA
ncbi:MAG: BCCT family transporter, partial [Hyphomonas sp.]|nr:BCCT family transporter [Hyphomonas sp.]